MTDEERFRRLEANDDAICKRLDYQEARVQKTLSSADGRLQTSVKSFKAYIAAERKAFDAMARLDALDTTTERLSTEWQAFFNSMVGLRLEDAKALDAAVKELARVRAECVRLHKAVGELTRMQRTCVTHIARLGQELSSHSHVRHAWLSLRQAWSAWLVHAGFRPGSTPV